MVNPSVEARKKMDADLWHMMERLGRIEHKADQILGKLEDTKPLGSDRMFLLIAIIGVALLVPADQRREIIGLIVSMK